MGRKLPKGNRTLLQSFEWHSSSHSGVSHYALLSHLLPSLIDLGVTNLWLSPGCKANNPQGNGYDIYDLWDLGEFHQKGAEGTKWGSKEELDALIHTAKTSDMEITWDAVLNHKAGADGMDEVWAVEVDKEDRRYEIGDPKQIKAWLHFDFDGRKDGHGNMKYSRFKWQPEHFNGTDWDHQTRTKVIYKLIDEPSHATPFKQPRRPSLANRSSKHRRSFLQRLSSFSNQSPAQSLPPPPPLRRPGKGWQEDVDDENGNNDFLMFSNIDYAHSAVREEVTKWGEWMVTDNGVDGFRLDAAQHFSFTFTREWICKINDAYQKQHQGTDVFVVGEVWTGDVDRILKWLDAVQMPSPHEGPQVCAYDSPLLYNFSRISEALRQGTRDADLRTLLGRTLLERRPEAAVTLVTNHDTQPGQTSYTPMSSILKTLWYAFILLRQYGYPCVFWGDLFGTQGPHAEEPACLVGSHGGRKRSVLPDLMLCRHLFAYGQQTDYWHSARCIGWTRAGSQGEGGCAVVLSIDRATAKRSAPIKMNIGSPGEVWTDVLGLVKEDVVIDEKGSGSFQCKGVSVFVPKTATGVERFPVDFDLDIYPKH